MSLSKRRVSKVTGGWRLDILDIWISHIWTSSYIWIFMSKCKLYPKVKFLYIQRISVSKNENKQYPNVKCVQKRNLMSKCKKTTHDKSILIKSLQSELAMNRDVSAVRQLVNRHDYSARHSSTCHSTSSSWSTTGHDELISDNLFSVGSSKIWRVD